MVVQICIFLTAITPCLAQMQLDANNSKANSSCFIMALQMFVVVKTEL